VKKELSAEGLYAGLNGLTGLRDAAAFWDAQPYGTRLYYSGGVTDYLHHSALKCAISAIERLSTNNDRLTRELAAAREQLSKWICVWCNHITLATGNPDADYAALQAHVLSCEASPLVKAQRELAAARELRQEQVVAAYIAGAQAVHDNWQPDRAPDFTEAAGDYWATIDVAIKGERRHENVL
jgi:hypothetical protein